MASSKEYLDYVLEQLSETGDVTSRAMMGEYILYFRGKVIGGIYDNRLLVKPVKAARRMMPDASEELPYDGAKPMLSVDNIEDKEFLKDLFEAIYDELPSPKKKQEMLPIILKNREHFLFLIRRDANYAFDGTVIYLSIKLLTLVSYAAESVG